MNQMCGADFVDCNDDDPVDGNDDLSATIYWGYTADSFFIAFDVTDQTIDADEGVAPFHNDGVELTIDADGDEPLAQLGFTGNGVVGVRDPGLPGVED